MDKRIEIIIGRPSTGKTLLATHLCRNAALNRKKFIYYSLELNKNTIVHEFGLLDKSGMIDDSVQTNLTDIIKSIIERRPDICVIDYLQLLKGYNENSLETIIHRFNSIENNQTQLIILAQRVLKTATAPMAALCDIVGVNKDIGNLSVNIRTIGAASWPVKPSL